MPDTSPVALADFIEKSRDAIVNRWARLVTRLLDGQELSGPVVRNNIDRVLDRIVMQLTTLGRSPGTPEPAAMDVFGHVVQRIAIGLPLQALAAELITLREVIEENWAGKDFPEARETLDALRRIVDRILLASIEQFGDVRMRLFSTVDGIVRSYPGKSLQETLHRILEVVFKTISGIDTAAILLLESADRLRVRAAVGLEEGIGFTVRSGKGFAGLIVAERQPRILNGANAIASLVLNPVIKRAGLKVLYGVPLLHGDQVLGVAHIGSRSTSDFSHETRELFHITMGRIAGILAQEVLREKIEFVQAQHKAVLDNSPVIIYSKDREGRYRMVSSRAVLKLGMNPKEFIGRTAHDVFPKQIADMLCEMDHKVIGEGTTVEQEEVVPRRDGEPRTYLVVKFPTRDSNGHIVGIGGVATDITERRRWESGQALVIETSALLGSSFDYLKILPKVASRLLPLLADCCIVDLIETEGIQRIAVEHRDPQKAELARRLLATPIDRSRSHLVDAVITSREPLVMKKISRNYLQTSCQSREERTLMLELAPRSMIQIPLVADNRLLGVLVFIRSGESPAYDDIDVQLAKDVGWRISLAIDNSRLYQAAQRATRDRQEVLGVVAHDLRNPLANIILAAQQLKDLPAVVENPAIGGPIEIVVRGTNRMKRLISDLLDQHAIESGQLSVSIHQEIAGALVRATAAAQVSRVESTGLSLAMAIADESAAVLADKDRILQVFANLLENAVKFTPAGGRVTLGVRRSDGEIQFFVQDSGPGIPEPILPHVFDRYWRAEHTDRRGLGLGLSICKGIVEAHHGRIWATNAPSGGALVLFALPEAPCP